MVLRGELYLARFPYSDLRGSKRRPICILSKDVYNSGPDVLAAMITSNRRRWEAPGIGDVRLSDWQEGGLLHPSVLRTAKLRDLEKFLLEGPIGRLTEKDQAIADEQLAEILGLGSSGS